MKNYPQNWRFCIFYCHFAQYLTIYATSRASTTYLCLAKCIFCIVLFVKPFVLSIYGFTVFQMAHWPQNWRFLYFLPPFCPKFCPFCNFQSLYNLFIPCKVHSLYCFVCATTFAVQLWIYSIPNGKLTLKLKILYFWPPFGLYTSLYCTNNNITKMYL